MTADTKANTATPSTPISGKPLEAPRASCLVNRFDHLEVATADINQLQKLFNVFGFVPTQERQTAAGIERLIVQGQIRVLLTQGAPGTFADEYVQKHGDGVCSIAYNSPDAAQTLKTAVERGAIQAMDLTEEKNAAGAVEVRKAAIKSFGDVRATFVERTAPAFDVNLPFGPGFKTYQANGLAPSVGLLSTDHLTNNVEMGTMEKWSNFYKDIYGWIEARYFDIRANHTGLVSKVLQSPDGATKIPINEATEKKSQVQEFIDMHRGAGVQHIAFTTNDIRATVRDLKSRGVKFLEAPPSTYYEDVAKRLPHVKEDLKSLQELGILIDGDANGYLLQIFSENQVGPMFFELIQRRGHNGFGEGNFRALFEAIERDQQRRGVL